MTSQFPFFVVWAGMALAVSGCAIPTHQTDAFLTEARDIPDAVDVHDVPFIEQDRNQCGPASLAMAMAHAGKMIPVEQLEEQVFTPGRKGSLQVDMIGAARRNGMMAVEINGLSSLLHEVAAGKPVITLQNLGLSWYPMWHYSVITGYDLDEPAVIMHSGSDKAREKDLRKFERSWMESNYWGLVILQPGELSFSADELSHAAAAAGLEQVGRLKEAELAYRSILERWPTSLAALIGMGNVRFAQGDTRQSAYYLRRAVLSHPKSSIAEHNLKVAEASLRPQPTL